MERELDKILEKHFNEGMRGVKDYYWNGSKFVLLTFNSWKKDYPYLYNVIMKSMQEIIDNERK